MIVATDRDDACKSSVRWWNCGEERRFETKMASLMCGWFYSESMKSISDLRRRIARLLALELPSISLLGQSGRTSVGSLSSAPRAVMRPSVVERFCCIVLVLTCGTGGGSSGEGVFRTESPPRDLGRRIVDARRILFWAAKFAAPSMGAV